MCFCNCLLLRTKSNVYHNKLFSQSDGVRPLHLLVMCWFAVLIPKYGLEGTLYLDVEGVRATYDEEVVFCSSYKNYLSNPYSMWLTSLCPSDTTSLFVLRYTFLKVMPIRVILSTVYFISCYGSDH